MSVQQQQQQIQLQQQQQQQQQQRDGLSTFKNHVTNIESQKSRAQRWQPHLDKLCVFFGELIATALLMFLGCMGCVSTSAFSNSHLQSALNFGFVVLICIQCFGCVSGAHLNPAVTLAAYVYRQLSLTMVVVYFVAQMLGSFIGYGLLKAVLPGSAINGPETPKGVCVTAIHSDLNPLQGLFIEFLITVALITICCAVWDPRNAKFQDSVAVRFGLAIACLSVAAGQFTGASMNPARSFGPALWNGFWENHWVYWVGPLAGALIASLIYKYAFRREVQADRAKADVVPELP